jgi:hypothetical protein
LNNLVTEVKQRVARLYQTDDVAAGVGSVSLEEAPAAPDL